MAHKHMMNMPKSARAGMPHYDEMGNPLKPGKPAKRRAAPKPRKRAKAKRGK